MVGGKLIFGSRDGILHAVSSSGEPLWHVALGAPSGPPVLIGRALFATTDPPVRAPRIVALDAGSGRALARADVPAGTSAVIDGAVVVATSDGRLIAYRPPRA
jgi:outer membrane protein assembly factor BamB